MTNRLPSSRQVLWIRSQSFTGLSAASIGASDVTLNIGQARRRTVLIPGSPKRDLSLIDRDRMNSAGRVISRRRYSVLVGAFMRRRLNRLAPAS
jgi:hypothetical protein